MNRHQRRAAKARRQIGGTGVFKACSSEQLARASMIADQAGQPGVAEILREVRRGGLAAGFCRRREEPLHLRDLERSSTPMVFVIGDDDYRSTGPAGWRCADTLARWARAAVIHAAAATPESYGEAVRAARMLGRAVLVETDMAHMMQWAELFRDRPVLVILATDGLHPMVPAREAVH